MFNVAMPNKFAGSALALGALEVGRLMPHYGPRPEHRRSP
jgi:hypothetical protein